VVLCAYNEEAWIGRALDSLAAQRHLPDEIIVVDNASTDSTVAVVQDRAEAHPALTVRVVHEAKKGLHHAREAGWRAATSDVIAMSDADIIFPPDWVQIIAKTFTTGGVDAITGSIRYYDAPAFINWMTWVSDQLFQPERIGRWITDEYVLNGGNSAYRRTVLEAVNGYLDKDADMLEDRHMSRMMKTGGYRIRFVRKLTVLHTFRRFAKDGWRGVLNYMFYFDLDAIYADHLEKDQSS
jgi:glycosyltransferase involved in cell wall biosynthesis